MCHESSPHCSRETEKSTNVYTASIVAMESNTYVLFSANHMQDNKLIKAYMMPDLPKAIQSCSKLKMYF